jgi:pimeloyl-ACP methyl ester carboxylesterase
MTDIPALILRGEEDVVIPASWDAQVKQDLPNSFHLLFPTVGHGVMKSNACARKAINSFLMEPTMIPDVDCY